VSFATILALWTLVTLPIKLICILLRWKHIQGNNYAILVSYELAKANVICRALSIILSLRESQNILEYSRLEYVIVLR